jgi:L-threonylcarbamoyladenylate synthase
MSDNNTEVHKAFEVIQNDGIILFPTDINWSIGCDASNEVALGKIQALLSNKLLTNAVLLMNGERVLYSVFSEIPEVAWQILDLSQKPTTLLLDNPRNIASSLIDSEKSVGFRIVKDPFCYKLIERMKKPLAVFSACKTESCSPKSFKEISAEFVKGVDYVVNLHREQTISSDEVVIKIKSNAEFKIIKK